MEYHYATCEDCNGTGVDPGSLMQPEPCPTCAGYGKLAAPQTVAAIARKYAGRADHAVAEAFKSHFQYYEERGWKCG